MTAALVVSLLASASAVTMTVLVAVSSVVVIVGGLVPCSRWIVKAIVAGQREQIREVLVSVLEEEVMPQLRAMGERLTVAEGHIVDLRVISGHLSGIQEGKESMRALLQQSAQEGAE